MTDTRTIIEKEFDSMRGLTARSIGEAIAIQLLEHLDDDVQRRVVVTQQRHGGRTPYWAAIHGAADVESAATKETARLAREVAAISWESLPVGVLAQLAASLTTLANHRTEVRQTPV